MNYYVQESPSVKRRCYAFVKRAFDIVASAAALIILSPIMLIAAILVYVDDPGKVFYGHVRIGKNGKPFKMWKFRSMYMNADKMISLLTPEQAKQYYTEFKIDNDPRITKIGNFLRKTSLDELPHLFECPFSAAEPIWKIFFEKTVEPCYPRHLTNTAMLQCGIFHVFLTTPRSFLTQKRNV